MRPSEQSEPVEPRDRTDRPLDPQARRIYHRDADGQLSPLPSVPLVSIVVPAYNAADHLALSLSSVATSLGPSAELIVVDDGSTDDTCAVFDQLQVELRLGNARLVRQVHSGVSAARNRGAASARGDYVIFLDADDWLASDLLDVVGPVATDRSVDADMICWAWDVAFNDVTSSRYFDTHPAVSDKMTGVEALRRTANHTLTICSGSAAYRRTFLDRKGVRYTPGCAYGEDLEFTYLALIAAERVVFVPRVLCRYQMRTTSVSQQKTLRAFESVQAMRRVADRLDCDPRAEVRDIGRRFDRAEGLYFHYLKSCLTWPGSDSPRDALTAIESEFPGLSAEVRGSVRAMSLRGDPIPEEWRVFAASPEQWSEWCADRRQGPRGQGAWSIGVLRDSG